MNALPKPNQNEPDRLLADTALRERIEKRAYHIWLARGRNHGDDLRHWLQAESEVLKAISREKEETSTVRRTTSNGKQRSAARTNEAPPVK